MWIVACLLALAAATPNAAPASPPAAAGPSSGPEVLRRYAWARLLEERGETADALNEYYRILVLEPRSVAVLARAAEAAARLGDAARSLELAERVLALAPGEARAHWLRGSARFNLGEPDAALPDLERALALDSARVEYARSLARAAEERDRVELVARAYRRVVELEGDDGEAWFQLAAAEARLGRFAAARAALAESRSGGRQRPGALFLEGWIAEGEGEPEHAIRAYAEHLVGHPADATTRSRLVRLLAATGRFGEALEEARRAAAAEPGSVDAHEDVAELALRADREPEGLAALGRMARLRPDDPMVLARRVDVLARHQRHRLAAAAAREWMAEHPGVPEGPYHLARVIAMSGVVEPAVAAAREAIAAAPDSLAPRVLLARILQQHERWDEAVAAWREAARRHPGEPGVSLDLAFCLQARGDTIAAETEVRQVLARHPDHPPALNFLGYLLAEANRSLPEAERMIQRALEREPANGAYVDSMGWVLYRLGRLAEARRELERAAALTGGDAVVLEHLGDVYRDLNLPDLAREQYRKALAAHGDTARLESKIRSLR